MDSNQLDNSSINHQTSPIPIQITYGYSRDHRPDLKQFILDLICSGDGDVPLFLRVASGNESDNSIFASICQDFKKKLNLDSLMVADSALYTAPNERNVNQFKMVNSCTTKPETSAATGVSACRNQNSLKVQ